MQAAVDHGKSVPRTALPLVGLLLLISPLALLGLLGFFAVFSASEDLLRGQPNLPHYELARRWTATRLVLPEQAASRGDFDGDGVDDVLENMYLRRENVDAESTSGMVYVWSGSDGELLLAHPTPTPMSTPLWCEDSNGDGADEVFVPGAPATMFAFERR